MSNRALLSLIGLVVFAMSILLLLNATPFFSETRAARYLTYNDIRGMAIEHRRLLYTLNFEQQNKVIEILNRAQPWETLDQGGGKRQPPDFSRLIIYFFNAPDVTIFPAYYLNDELIFTCQEWNGNGLLKEESRGELKKWLAQMYDP